jgi:hypothetical protein
MEKTMIDKSLFSVKEREGEYYATFHVEGEIRVQIKASSKEDAQAKAEAMLEDDDFGQELDEVTNADVSYVWKAQPMYRVTRDGEKMQVSRLEAGDEPREPDERGF